MTKYPSWFNKFDKDSESEVFDWDALVAGYTEPVETKPSNPNEMRTFDTGATRHVDEDKLDYEGFLSPVVLERFAQFLHEHRLQADGKLRASDNWQKGIPLDVYCKSLIRHTFETWRFHRQTTDSGYKIGDTQKAQEDALCAVIFNSMGYLFELLRKKDK